MNCIFCLLRNKIKGIIQPILNQKLDLGIQSPSRGCVTYIGPKSQTRLIQRRAPIEGAMFMFMKARNYSRINIKE